MNGAHHDRPHHVDDRRGDDSRGRARTADEAGLGALRTERGNLPLDCIDVRAEITGLTSRVELTQEFVNAFDVPLEASYVFPLPDRGAVTRMQMTADGRVIEAELREREAARQAYDEAIASGRRASIAEEERPEFSPCGLATSCPVNGSASRSRSSAP